MAALYFFTSGIGAGSRDEPEKDPPYVDISVAEIVLVDPASARRFFQRYGQGFRTEAFGTLAIQFLNRDGTQLLELVGQPGGSTDDFEEIVVRAPTADELGRAPRLPLVEFRSGKGLRLGATYSEVIALLGKPHHSHRESADRRTVTYRCKDPRLCPSLTKVNMPTYEVVLVLVKGRLSEYRLGYPYP